MLTVHTYIRIPLDSWMMTKLKCSCLGLGARTQRTIPPKRVWQSHTHTCVCVCVAAAAAAAAMRKLRISKRDLREVPHDVNVGNVCAAIY